MNKKFWVLIIVLVVLVVVFIGYKTMTDIPKVEVYAMEEQDRLPIGRASIGFFGAYKVVGNSAYYDGATLHGNNAVSEPSFLAWVDQRWKKIREKDAKLDIDHQPEIYRLAPHKVGFKFNALNIGKPSSPNWAYYGEGGVWFDNKALFISPGGAPDTTNKTPNIVGNAIEMKSKDAKGFCLDFYCLNLPVSSNESAEIAANFDGIDGLMLSVSISTYTSSQNDYFSERVPSGGIIVSSVTDVAKFLANYYSNAEKREVDGVIGEQDIFGVSDPIGHEYSTAIQARWYHPGTSGDTSDPSIEINLVYEFKTDHKPSKSGWFDDETVKQTGFTPEKFISMWEATLKSFKRNR